MKGIKKTRSLRIWHVLKGTDYRDRDKIGAIRFLCFQTSVLGRRASLTVGARRFPHEIILSLYFIFRLLGRRASLTSPAGVRVPT